MATGQLKEQVERLLNAIVYQRQTIAEKEEALDKDRVTLNRLEGQHQALTTQLEIAEKEEDAAREREDALRAELAELRAQLAGASDAERPAAPAPEPPVAAEPIAVPERTGNGATPEPPAAVAAAMAETPGATPEPPDGDGAAQKPGKARDRSPR